jgi:hypothetical protein
MSPSALAWKPSVDRRTRRSEAPSAAARHYLDRVRERCAADRIVLAEGDAILAESSREAASSPVALAKVGREIVDGLLDAGWDDTDVFAHEIRIGERGCVLVSVGHRVDRVKTVAADLTRILA